MKEIDWEKWQAQPFSLADTPKNWPRHVRSISTEGLMLLGIGDGNKLYWDGKQLEMRRSLKLDWWQNLLVFFATAAALITAVVEVLRFLGLGH